MNTRMRTLCGIVGLVIAMAAGDAALAGQTALMGCQLSNSTPNPGSSVACDIVLTDAADVRAYQTRITITRTSGTGTVSVNCPGGVAVNTGRGDYIFTGQPNTFPTTNCAQLKAASAMLAGGVTVGATPVYLSTYTLSVSPDAAPGSTFEIAVLGFSGSNGSQLADSANASISFGTSSPCVLTIPVPTLSLHGPVSVRCLPTQASFDATLEVSDLTAGINGVQALFTYNPALLSLTSITPGDGIGSPWDSALPVFFNDNNGSVTYALTLIASQTSANAVVATLHFNAVAPGSSAIAFAPASPPFETKLTRASDSQPIYPDTLDSGSIQAASSPTPTVTADPGITVCSGTPVTLDAGAGYSSYLWSPGGATTQTIQVSSSGVYSVTVTNASGCQGSDDITITVNSSPSVSISAAPGESVCAGTPVTLNAGAGYTSYLWSPGGESTQTIQVTQSGNYSVTVSDANGCTDSESILVTVNANPTPAISALPGETVCSGTPVTIDAGAGYASYLWSPGGATTQTIQVTQNGSYSVTVTDANGCSGSDSILITINASPAPTIVASDEEVCSGTPVTLDAGAGYASYLWSPGGATTQTIQVTQSGTYSVTVTDGNGCSGSDSILITVNEIPSVTIGAMPGTAVCDGTPVTLDAGAGYASYLWSPGGETTQTIQVTESGIYSVTVSNGNDCVASDDIVITVNANPAPTISADPGESVCDGATVTLDAGAGYSGYLWSPGGEITRTIEVTTGGVYSVTVTDANGCSGSDDISITISPGLSPAIVATPGESVCDGTPVTLDVGVGYASYLWSPGGETTQTIIVTNAGSYSVVVTDANDCIGSDDITISVNPNPTVAISAVPAEAVCVGTPVTLDAGAGFASYLWSPGGETTQTIQVTQSGTYSVTVSNGNNCEASDSILITVNANPAPTITAVPGSSICAGGNATLDAGAGYASYLWSPGGETTRTIVVTAGGAYSVVVTNGSGCSGSDDITVTVNPNPSVTITASSQEIDCGGTPVTLNAGAGFASYLWSPGGATTQTIQVFNPGTYSVTVTDANGCSATDDILITGAAAPNCTITMDSSVCQGSTASIASVADAGVGATYIWAIGGGTIESGQGTPSITFSASTPGTVLLFVSVTNAQNCNCLGSDSATVVASRCGDMNNDGIRNGRDIQPFTSAILNPGSLSASDFCAADMDHDGVLEPADDVALFVTCLLTQSCSCVP